MSVSSTGSERVLMLGTFGMKPKGTMSARAAGIAGELQQRGWHAEIVTVPWDNPGDAGTTSEFNGIPVTNTRVIKPYLWPLAIFEMIQAARRFRPDVIHLFKPKGFGDLAARYLRRLGYPVVVDMDDWEGSGGWNDALPYSRLERRLFDWQERSWPQRADGITVASRTLAEYAITLGATPDDVLYLPNQLTSERFQTLTDESRAPSRNYDELHAHGDDNLLLYTRFVEFEPQYVIRIFQQLVARKPDVRLVVAGRSADGQAGQSMLQEAGKVGLRDRITLLGWINPDDLGWIARQCSVALVPFDDSLINRAKCSIKLLELVACGLPVVATSVGENREYLNRHGVGYLARPGDAENHADQLLGAYQDRKAGRFRSSTFGDAGLWSQSVESVETHLRRAIARTRDRKTGS